MKVRQIQNFSYIQNKIDVIHQLLNLISFNSRDTQRYLKYQLRTLQTGYERTVRRHGLNQLEIGKTFTKIGFPTNFTWRFFQRCYHFQIIPLNLGGKGTTKDILNN